MFEPTDDRSDWPNELTPTDDDSLPEPDPLDPPIVEEHDRVAVLAELAAAAGGAAGSRPLQPVGIGMRIAAALIDGFAVLFAMLAVVVCPALLASESSSPWWFGLVVPALVSAAIGGHVAVEVFGGRTLGRVFTDSRATRVDGGRPSVRQRAVRAGLRNLPLFVLAAWAVAGGVADLAWPSGASDHGVRRAIERFGAIGVPGSSLAVLASGLCVLVPPHLALHDRIAGMAVYDESDLARHRRRPGGDGPTGGFDVIQTAVR